MTLRIIRPAWADDDLVAVADMLVVSNVAEDVLLWDPVPTYAVGDRRRRDTTHRIYEAGAPSTNKVPETNLAGTPAPWIDVQATNRFAMFDAVNNTVTSNPESIDVTLSPGRFNSLYLGGLDAATVDVTVAVDGVVVDSRHLELLVDNVFSWSEWLSEPIIRDTDAVLFDLNGYGGATLRVVISQPEGVAKCGTLVVGRSRVLGEVQSSAGFRIKANTSYKENGFGGVKKTKRPGARRIQAQVFASNAMFDEVNRLMMEYDGDTLLWSFSYEYKTLNALGYKEDFDSTIKNESGFFYNLQVLGMI
ncbi:hypothetical protein IP91_00128 [Pseudoduganella lurida]|uniref:Carbohydrate-binding protein n=1 Tax=Pseudoduganella lurida TaxID=1036180 RepID=A0A562RJE8_9BURK|nr:hypothetical protein [Pseudoduganella lurida]TWI69063.1 hypothetical protein IP91_00128 [Pseudoduganella lurida]